MSAGHDGILMGVNASSPQEALIRLEMMAALANPPVSPVWMRQQIVSAIDLVVHTARMRDGFCRIISITEVSACTRIPLCFRTSSGFSKRDLKER
jgi:pilus assembly protein CpaF